MQDAISNVALIPYEHMIADNKDNLTLSGFFAHHISNMHNRRRKNPSLSYRQWTFQDTYIMRQP
jgi:hypothetical protein